MSSVFYNTISFDGEALTLANAKASKQADIILAIFQANPKMKFSPSKILSLVRERYGFQWPITSVRRAMTDLSSPKCDNVLLKTAELVPSPEGSVEHLWVLAVGNGHLAPEKSRGHDGFPEFMRRLKEGGATQKEIFGE